MRKKFKKTFFIKVLSMVLVCLLFAGDTLHSFDPGHGGDSIFALAPPFAMHSEFTDIRNEWVKVHIGYFLGDFLRMAGKDPDITEPKAVLVPLLRKYILKLEELAGPLKEKYHFEELEEIKKEQALGALRIPLMREGEDISYIEVSLISGREDMGSTVSEIFLEDGTKVYISLIPASGSTLASVSFFHDCSVKDISRGVVDYLMRLENILRHNEHNWTVAGSLIDALGDLYAELVIRGKMPVSFLEKRIRYRDGCFRTAAVKGLGQVCAEEIKRGEHEERFLLLEDLLSDEDPDIIRTAADVLGEVYHRLCLRDETFKRVLEQRLFSENVSMRLAAAKALGKVYADEAQKGEISVNYLENRVYDDNWAVRHAVITALGKVYAAFIITGKDPDISVLEDIAKKTGKDDQYYTLSSAIAEVYYARVKSGKISIFLLENLLSEDTDYLTRQAASRALMKVYEEKAGQGIISRDFLEERYVDENWAVRKSVDGTLRPLFEYMVKKQEISRTDLENLIESDDPDVRWAAITVLGSLCVETVRQGKIFDDDLERYVLWNKFGLPYNSDKVKEYLSSRDPGGFVSSYISEAFKVSAIDFCDGGNAVSNFSDLARAFFRYVIPQEVPRPEGLPVAVKKTPQNIPFIELKQLLPDLILEKEPDMVVGRTLIYSLPGERSLHIKLLKNNEDPGILAYEYDMMGFLNDMKEKWGLKGRYPSGVVRLGRLVLDDLFKTMIDDMSFPKNNFIVDTSDLNVTFMAYETEFPADSRNPYVTYLNDPDLSNEEFSEGFRVNVHDRMVMARHGIFDLEMIELFHNADDDRRYDWMVDISPYQPGRKGAGRLNNITAATLYPNVRLSGPADFAGLRFAGDLLDDHTDFAASYDRLSRLWRMTGGERERTLNYFKMGLTGDIMLSLSLVLVSYMDRRKEIDYQQETNENDTFLQETLKSLFELSVSTYKDGLMGSLLFGDFQLMARQIAFSRPPLELEIPEDLYPGAKIGPVIPGRGWESGRKAWDVSLSEHSIPSREVSKQKDKLSWDLGPVNGPMPYQELIRAMYLNIPFVIGSGPAVRHFQSISPDRKNLSLSEKDGEERDHTEDLIREDREKSPRSFTLTEGKVKVEHESLHARSFRTMMGYIRGKQRKRPLFRRETDIFRDAPAGSTADHSTPAIIAIGKRWLRGYARGTEQFDALNPLIASIRNYCERSGTLFIIDDDDTLADVIARKKSEKNIPEEAKVIILAGADDQGLLSGSVEKLSRRDSYTVVGIDGSQLPENNYHRIMEILTIALGISMGIAPGENNENFTVFPPEGRRGFYIIVPQAVPIDHYEDLRALYAVQISA